MNNPGNAATRKFGGISGSHFWFIAILAAIAAVGFWVAPYNGLMAWLFTVFLMTLLVISAGKNIQGFFFGFLIDRRNKYSLSRLQTLVWTIIVLSAFFTAAFINLAARAPDALAVAVPEQLWVLMGISVTSLLGSPLLVNQKRTGPGKRAGAPDTPGAASPDASPAAQSGSATASIRMDGEVVEKADPNDAAWSDLFKGEVADDHQYLDISKVQMFFFSFILVTAYGFQLGQMFAGYAAGEGMENTISSLPLISNGMLALLGISHTAYLGNKVVPSRRDPAS